jgi:hypothetical protein
MLIKEQMRKYKMKMEEINHLEAAESIAFRRLSLLRQNAVSAGLGAGPPAAGLWYSHQKLGSVQCGQGPCGTGRTEPYHHQRAISSQTQVAPLRAR